MRFPTAYGHSQSRRGSSPSPPLSSCPAQARACSAAQTGTPSRMSASWSGGSRMLCVSLYASILCIPLPPSPSTMIPTRRRLLTPTLVAVNLVLVVTREVEERAACRAEEERSDTLCARGCCCGHVESVGLGYSVVLIQTKTDVSSGRRYQHLHVVDKILVAEWRYHMVHGGKI
jgi:hypothetical protein